MTQRLTQHMFTDANVSRFFVENVYPRLPAQQKHTFHTRYPHITFEASSDSTPLSQYPVLMLVAFTGTGKTTTLDALSQQKQAGIVDYRADLPTRRELADFFVIPSAQIILGDAIHPVKDRVQRFHYTRTFADHIAGGMATVYSQLHITQQRERLPFVSDGIRGSQEIACALRMCPQWHITELFIDTIERLKRLSYRNDRFDMVAADETVNFLPESLQAQVKSALSRHEITPNALTIVQAEAKNYGLTPYSNNDNNPRYHALHSDSLSPKSVAHHISNHLKALA